MKYTVVGVVTVSVYTEVEADNEKEAIEIAERRDLAPFDVSATYGEDEYFIADNDGSPKELRIEE